MDRRRGRPARSWTSASRSAARAPRAGPRRACDRARSSAEQLLARVALVRLAQVLERLALGLRQLRRHLHAQPREQVAAPAALQLRRAAPLDAKELSVARAGRHLQRDAPVGRRDLDLRAKRSLVERDGDLEHEVVAAALVELRRLDARDDVEVAGRRAAEARLALALQLDLRPVLDAGGDVDRVALRAPLA